MSSLTTVRLESGTNMVDSVTGNFTQFLSRTLHGETYPFKGMV